MYVRVFTFQKNPIIIVLAFGWFKGKLHLFIITVGKPQFTIEADNLDTFSLRDFIVPCMSLI